MSRLFAIASFATVFGIGLLFVGGRINSGLGDEEAAESSNRATYSTLDVSSATWAIKNHMACPPAGSTSVTVTNTNDSGPGSLREAIGCANADATLDLIDFAVNGTIQLLSPLPIITDAGIQIDGGANNIILDGSLLGFGSNGIMVQNADNVTIARLEIRSFADDGIVVDGSSNCSIDNNRLEDNGRLDSQGEGIHVLNGSSNVTVFNNVCINNAGDGIDINATDGFNFEGNTCQNNGRRGIDIFTSSNGTLFANLVGSTGSADNQTAGVGLNNSTNITFGNACVIANNNGPGIFVEGSSSNISISGSYIGSIGAGADVGNAGFGIEITNGAGQVLIANNDIAFNALGAINVGNTSDGVRITQNRIFCNRTAAIQLDGNANQGLLPSTIDVAATNRISGMTSEFMGTFTLEFYRVDQSICGFASTVCQGYELLGTTTISVDPLPGQDTDPIPWDITPNFTLNEGDEITVLTINQDGSSARSSAFSNCITVTPPCPEVFPAGPIEECFVQFFTPFDLTSVEADLINGQSGVTVNWYEDFGRTQLISNTNMYEAMLDMDGRATVYAATDNGICESSSLVAVELIELTMPYNNGTVILPATVCVNEQIDVTLDLQGGTPPYSGSFLIDGQSVHDFSNQGPGLYSFSFSLPTPGTFQYDVNNAPAIVDAKGCFNFTDVITVWDITVLDNPVANAIPPILVCGNTIDQSVNLTQYDGDIGGGSSVTWYQDAGATNPISNPTSYFVNADETVYAVVNNGSCASAPEAIVLDLVDPPREISGAGFSGTYCLGELLTLNLEFTGGTPPYSGWVSVAGTDFTFGPTSASQVPLDVSFNQLGTFDYTETPVYVEDANGCTRSTFTFIQYFYEVVDGPTANPAGPLTACDEGPGVATFDLTALDAEISPEGYTVEWHLKNDGTSPIFNPDNLQIESTTVYARVDNAGCLSDFVPVQLIVAPLPQLSCTPTPTSVLGATDGSITIVFTDATAPLTLDWSGPATGTTTLPSAADYTLADLPEGTYTLTVVDANGCTGACMVTIISGECNLGASLNFTPTSCFGATDGSIVVNATGGTGVLTYDWSDNALDGQQNPTMLSAGPYAVTVTDESGCMAMASGTLAQPAELTLACTEGNPATGGQSNGSVAVTIGGGSPGYTIAYSGPQSGSTAATVGTTTLADLSAGDYGITVTDANGCVTSCNLTLTSQAGNAPTAILLTTDNIICATSALGGSCEGAVTFRWQVLDNCDPLDDFTVVVTLDAFADDTDGNGTIAAGEFVADGPLPTTRILDTFAVAATLPLGLHALRLRVTDPCGGTIDRYHTFRLADCSPPLVACTGEAFVPLLSDGAGAGTATLAYPELLLNDPADCSAPLSYALYRTADVLAAGAGFSPAAQDSVLTLSCADVGYPVVRLYAIDAAGNASYCETTVRVDPAAAGICDGAVVGSIQLDPTTDVFCLASGCGDFERLYWSVNDVCPPAGDGTTTVNIDFDQTDPAAFFADASVPSLSDPGGTYLNVDFPTGDHLLRWQYTDGCGLSIERVRAIRVVDCTPGNEVCVEQSVVYTLQADGGGGGVAFAFAEDLISYVPPCGNYQAAIYRTADVLAAGPGFVPDPADVGLVLTCEDLGAVEVNLYLIDANDGSFAYCPVFVAVQSDDEATCGPADFTSTYAWVTTDFTFCTIGPDCAAEVTLELAVDDNCPPATDLRITAYVDLEAVDGNSDGEISYEEFISDGQVTVSGSAGAVTISDNLPIGEHAVLVLLEDGCGRTEILIQKITVEDCHAPTPICISGVTATLMPDGNGGGMASVAAIDYIATPATDCSEPVTYAIYRSTDAQQPGFTPDASSTEIMLTCADLGSLPARIYTFDAAGNYDYCESIMFVDSDPGVDCGVSGQLTFTFPDTLSSGVGETLCLPLRVSGFTDINSVQFTISFDPDNFMFSHVQNFGLPGLEVGDFGFANADQGMISMSWLDELADGETLSDGSTLFTICLEVVGCTIPTEVTINGSPLAIEIVDNNDNLIDPIIESGQIDIPPQQIPGVLTGGPFFFCGSDGIPDLLTPNEVSQNGASGTNETWIITDASGQILSATSVLDFDFDVVGAGTYQLYHLSHDNPLTGAVPGGTLGGIGGCYATSNAIAITVVELSITTCSPFAPASGAAVADGSAQVGWSGGQAPYSFSWQGPSPGSQSGLGGTGTTITDLLPGDYVVTVSDANGCQVECNFTVDFDTGTVLTVSADIQPASCTSADGRVVLTVLGGTEPYTFTWRETGNPATIASSKDLVDVAAGTYEVLIRDAVGLERMSSFVVPSDDQPVSYALNATICPGDPGIDVNGTLYDLNNPNGTETLLGAAANGCDSVVIVSITEGGENPVFETRNATICEGDTYVFYAQQLTAGGTFFAEPSCDSTIRLILTVTDAPDRTIVQTICSDEQPDFSLTVGDMTFDRDNPAGQVFLPSGESCDSLIRVDLTFLDPEIQTVELNACYGQPLNVNGIELTADRTMIRDTVPGGAVNGCNLYRDIVLNFRNNFDTLRPVLCAGEVFDFQGTVYTIDNPEGVHILDISDQGGCDSTVFVRAEFGTPSDTLIQALLCDGETLTVADRTFDRDDPQGTVTLTNVTGCDSLVTVDLFFRPPAERTIRRTACAGEVVVILGTELTEEDPMQTLVIPGVAPGGCDSLLYLEAEFLAVTETTPFELDLCPNDSIQINGTWYLEPGSYQDTLRSVAGCDSVISTVILNALPTYEEFRSETICAGESLSIGACTYTESGTYDCILSTVNGCDSLIQLDLTVLPVVETRIDSTICYDESIVVNGEVYDRNRPQGTERLPAASGCDSTVVVALDFYPERTNQTEEIALCSGEELVRYEITIDSAGVYSITLFNAAGCDSVWLTLNVTETELETVTEQRTLCDGETTLFFGKEYGQTGRYEYRVSSPVGCDSLYILDLTVRTAAELLPRDDEFAFLRSTQEVAMPVLENDSLPAGEVFLRVVRPAVSGQAEVLQNQIVFRPDGVRTGLDSLEYKVCLVDCPQVCERAVVRLSVDFDCLAELSIDAPNAFTPNGDGFNDEYDPVVEVGPGCEALLEDVEILIVNTWGEIVFHPAEYRAWNGSTLDGTGGPAPEGNYFAILTVSGLDPIRIPILLTR